MYKAGFDHARRLAKKEARSKFLSGVSNREFIQIQITRESERELEWKHSKEFRFRGHMYDIISVQSNSFGTVYTVWPDAKESALYRKFQSFLNDFAGGQPLEKGKSLLIQNLLKACYEVIPFLSCPAHENQLPDRRSAYLQKRIAMVFLPVSLQPPE